MNLFQLEYFIVLAETLSYTKASQQLHITQPTLSKLVINLEHSIGSQLFIRNKREVKLTPTGKIFYHEIRKILHAYDSAVIKVKDMENGTTGVISIGLLGTALVHHFPKLIKRFHELHPTIKVNPMDYTYDYIMETLTSGQIDVAILPDIEIDCPPQFIKKTVFTDHMCVVLPQNHKFSELKSVSLTMIKDEPFIHMDPKYSRTDHNLIDNIYSQEGFSTNTVYEANSLINMMLMVDCQLGISLLASHMKQFANDTVRFVPLIGFENYFKVICLYNRESNDCIEKLLEVADEYFNSCSNRE
ncbi:LysR family transcriptional regulator [Clostridium boliviensis]|uniref:LysR family transcriptional regulator n=1 Tax=Clostridium boliviensis TaxID=318465 RepID=A0ABU4GGQ7_9CLOT|nr:LysR family transcriptional regulator [Clostridium boliviensis]MDW2796192.1 LysR family transcriptional regulator [Clostridium boliviensis]